MLAVELLWNKQNYKLLNSCKFYLRNLPWQFNLSNIENKQGIIMFYSTDQHNQLVIDYVSTSYQLETRMTQLRNEHPHLFDGYTIAYAYHKERDGRYHVRNLLKCLQLPPYLRS